MVLDVRMLLDLPEVGLVGQGFKRVSRSAMEKRVAPDLYWRVVAIKDRDDPPSRVTLDAGIYVPALVPVLPYALPDPELPGIFSENLFQLAGRPRAKAGSLFDANRARLRWLLRKPSLEERRAATITDLLELMAPAMAWFAQMPDLATAAGWRQQELLTRKFTVGQSWAELGGMWLLANEPETAEQAFGRVTERDDVKYMNKIRRAVADSQRPDGASVEPPPEKPARRRRAAAPPAAGTPPPAPELSSVPAFVWTTDGDAKVLAQPGRPIPFLHVMAHDGDIGILTYDPEFGGAGIAYAGVAPRTYFEDETAAPTDKPREVAALTAWLRSAGVQAPNLEALVEDLLVAEGEMSDEAFVEVSLSTFFAEIGLPWPEE